MIHKNHLLIFVFLIGFNLKSLGQINDVDIQEIRETINSFFSAKNNNNHESVIEYTHPYFFKVFSKKMLELALKRKLNDKSLVTKQIPDQIHVLKSKNHNKSKYVIVQYLLNQTTHFANSYSANDTYKVLKRKYENEVSFDSIKNEIKLKTLKKIYVIKDSDTSTWKVLNIQKHLTSLVEPFFPLEIQKWVQNNR